MISFKDRMRIVSRQSRHFAVVLSVSAGVACALGASMQTNAQEEPAAAAHATGSVSQRNIQWNTQNARTSTSQPTNAADVAAINPQPLPPAPPPVTRSKRNSSQLGEANAINPQPLPPDPAAFTRSARHALKFGEVSAINPQPLPPDPTPVVRPTVQKSIQWRTPPGHAATSLAPPQLPSALNSGPSHLDPQAGVAPGLSSNAGHRAGESTVAGQTAMITVDTSLTPPTGLTTTVNQTMCSQHGGFGAGLACKALLPQGRIALIWDYGKSNRVKGYNIYRVDNGQQSLVYVQDAGINAKAWVIDPVPEGGYAGACYAVSAYGVKEESKLSSSVCADPTKSIQTLSLAPIDWRLGFKINGRGQNLLDQSSLAGVGQPRVGYNYTTFKQNVGAFDYNSDSIARVGLRFDLSPIAGRNIHVDSARLLLTVDSSWTGQGNLDANGPPNDHETSCTAKIGSGRDYWWDKKRSDWIEGDVELTPGETHGPDVSLDVTKIVGGWANGQRNFGLVLQGEEENLLAFTEKSCMTVYVTDSIRLEIKYH